MFKDVSKLSFDYVPEKLVHREQQYQRLLTLFRPLIDQNRSQNAFLHGSVGTGKTALSKRFCLDFKELCQKNNRYIEYVLVNCRQRPNESSVMLKVLNHFDPNFPDRGFSITEMSESLRKHLEKRKAHLILILDEADVLLKKSGSDLIYNFSRFEEERFGGMSPISLILISQKQISDVLDSQSLSSFKRTNVIEFTKYSQKELFDILKSRTDLAFHSNTVERDVLELISDIASEWGDARYAIELLEMAGMLADERNSEIVTPEFVRAAKAETYSVITESKLIDLDRTKKLVLLAIARAIKDKVYIGTGEAEKVYHLVCEEYTEPKKGHTQFWSYLKELDSLGLIDTKKSGEGITGRTTLISLPDIPANVLELQIAELLSRK